MLNICKTILIMGFFILTAAIPAVAFDDAILAQVNDEIITQKDLQEYIHSTYVNLVTQGVPEDKISDMMKELETDGLDRLIEDKLMLSRANELGIEIPEKRIQERVDGVKAKYASEDEFTQALIKNGATPTDFRNKVVDQLKISAVIEHEVKEKIYIKPQDVTDFYKNNPDKFRRPERVNVDSIFIKFKDDKAQAREKATEAVTFIKSGEDFKKIAEKYSDAPSLGVVERGSLMKNIEDILFGLPPDQVSEPTEVENGIFIFKITGKVPEIVAPLGDVKADVAEYLERKQMHDKYTAWIEGLKKKAYVDIKK